MFRLSACILTVAILICLPSFNNGGNIEHVVVLMLENRAFDHMVGFLKRVNPEIDGLNGDESNPINPADKTSPRVQVTDDSEYIEFDPDHGVVGTSYQTFGYLSPTDTYNTNVDAPMNGFVMDGLMRNKTVGASVMRCFAPEAVPAISTLAQEFMIFDRWHASVPGPTQVNRLFLHSATSHGLSHNDDEKLEWGFPQKTIYESLDESNVSWNIFMEQITTVVFFNSMRRPEYAEKLRFFNEFEASAKAGTLPTYSFIEPRYASETVLLPANDQHPSHDVVQGEKLIARVYSILRSSPLWNKTALILTYDEHGGFYDHYPVPQRNVPNPDGIVATDPPFGFTRLGVRVPTIIASPWIPKGYVEHEPVGPTPYSHYEHSSIAATMKKMFNLTNFLTKRDAWAGTFEHLFTLRDTPRTDCPLTLPTPKKFKPSTEFEHLQPVNDLQKELISLAAAVGGSRFEDVIGDIKTEYDAGTFMLRQMEKLLGRKRAHSD